MSSPCTRIIAFIALAFTATTGFAARGVLRADGIIRVKGADPSTTSVTVVPDGAPSYSLPIGTLRFMLSLPLDDVYLIRVTGEGCPAKEIYLDTRVPVEMHAADFEFPFMVNLEHMAPELMFVYAGPVGFVHYLDPLKDFGYETQYMVHVDERLELRMDEVLETGVDPKVFLPMLPARVVDLPRGDYSTSSEFPTDAGSGTLAPIVSEVALMIHVVNAAAALPASGLLIAPAILLIEADVVLSEPVEASGRYAAAGIAARAPGEVPRPIIALVRDADSLTSIQEAVLPAGAMIVEVWRSLRTEELITEARMLTRIIRFSTPSNGSIEFRKVTHAFGAVYFFIGNRSITERDFEEATAPEVVGAL